VGRDPIRSLAAAAVMAGSMALIGTSSLSWSEWVTGAVAGVIVVLGVLALDKYLDDPVGALPAHGLAGIWGTLSCGLFTTPALAKFNGVGQGGLFYTGSFHQLGAQAIAVTASFVTVFVLSYALFWIIKKTYGLRVSEAEEDAGLDISEHGMYGYPEQFIPAPELVGYGGSAVPAGATAMVAPKPTGRSVMT